jgi:hypothetical protein
VNINVEIIKNLYEKERQYQKDCFGEYGEIDSFNIATFLVFLKKYLNDAEKAYCGPWEHESEKPEWLDSCKESEEGIAPYKTYAALIKILALAGAALETYAVIKPQKWREDSEKEGEKWRK